MNATFLAVVIIMALLVLFVLVILQSLAGAAGVRIRMDMVRLLESYDKIAEKKSREINRLQIEAERLRLSVLETRPAKTQAGKRQSENHASIPRTACYRSKAFGDGYSAIRAHFDLNRERYAALVAHVEKVSGTQAAGRGIAAAKLRRALSFDTVFRLSQMSGKQQLEILDTTLEDEGWALLRDFQKEQAGRSFETGRFCHWLSELEALESPNIIVRCGNLPHAEEKGTECVPGICEGIQIISGGKLYDYSIQEREIS